MAQANAEGNRPAGRALKRGRGHPPTRTICKSSVPACSWKTAYAARWCAEAIELLQRNSGSTAIMSSEPIQRAWRDARVITLHGALNLEALSENYGRLMGGASSRTISPGSRRSTASRRCRSSRRLEGYEHYDQWRRFRRHGAGTAARGGATIPASTRAGVDRRRADDRL